MADETEGGIYKDASGDGYHDADGKPVPAPKSIPVKAGGGNDPFVTIETVKEEPLVTTETVEIVDTGTGTVIDPDAPKGKAKG